MVEASDILLKNRTDGTPSLDNFLGPLAVTGACIAWGIDNNLTRKVSHANPLQIVQIKGLVAGPVYLALALSKGGSLPQPTSAVIALLVGFVGYGVSIAFLYWRYANSEVLVPERTLESRRLSVPWQRSLCLATL